MPSRSDRPPVRHNQTLDYDGLRDEAKAAAKLSGKTQTELAEHFGVTQPAISQALNAPGPRLVALQSRIVAAFTEYEIEPVEQVVTFRVARKA